MVVCSPSSVSTPSEPGTALPTSESDPRVVSCEHADRCGGCPAIQQSYGEQLASKQARLTNALVRYADLSGQSTDAILGAEAIVGYRTRAKLIVAAGGRLGLFAKGGGHQVVDIPQCRVLAPSLAAVAEFLRARIREHEQSGGPLAPYDPPSGGALRGVDLRETKESEDAPARVLVTLIVQRTQLVDLAPLRAEAQAIVSEVPSVAGVAVNFHDGELPQVLGGETSVLAGVTSVPDRVGGSVHLATYGSFVQAHRGQASRVHQMVIAAFDVATAREQGRAVRVVDLYGGSGAIALSLASAGADVHLVESFAPAVASAQAAASAQGLPLRAECGDVATVLRTLVDRGARYDGIVVNPPRRGVSPVAREWVARLGAPTIVYVSCDPDTLTRDLDHFRRLGYAPRSLRPLDMIPLTEELETVAVLDRAAPSVPRVIFENEEILVVEKAPHEPTAPQGEYTTSLLARARRLPGAEVAVPVHRLDVGTSGLVMLAKSQAFVARWQEVLGHAATRKVYVAGVRGVTPSKGAITRDLREDGKLFPARTRYRRLAVASGHSILRVIPEQGRMHQIRRHLAAIGHPILGDDRYGHAPSNRFFEEKNALDRPFLHCVRLEFDDPLSGHRMILEAPLSGDLRGVIERTSGMSTLRFLDHKNALGTGLSSFPPPPSSSLDSSALEALGVESSRMGNDDNAPETLPSPAPRTSEPEL